MSAKDAPRQPAVRPPFSRPFEVAELQRDRSVRIAVEASPDECAAVAASLGLEAVRLCKARYELTGLARGVVRVQGTLDADISQTCVVTLEPFDSRISETVDVKFAPEAGPVRPGREKTTIAEAETITMDEDPPDPIVDGRIDLGQVSVEFLVLALDPYPRKPGVEFALPQDDVPEPEESPFAALARLKGGET